ncbi:MAG: threonine aldolase family protein [Chthoniobacterales bacterium]
MERYDFASDNTAPISPPVWEALVEANRDTAPSYGEDRWTKRARQLVRELFETDCEAFFVFNGTAANALALAQLCRPFDAVFCHERAHIQTDECGAPEFFSAGAKLVTTSGANGKLDLAQVALALTRFPDVHSSKPRVVSVTQATEFGTVYKRDELERIAQFARERSLFVHMDGARFANAIASLGCAPKSITWEIGTDVLCFGGIKNGGAVGELVIFFNKQLARDFEYRVKQAGQLASKMRFIAAAWVALLENATWLQNARHANDAAKLLAEKLSALPGIVLSFPTEANAVFVRFGNALSEQLQNRGWRFLKFVEPNIYRLMCSWATSEQVIDAFGDDVRELVTHVD